MAALDTKIQAFLGSNRKFAETWRMPATMEQIRAVLLHGDGGTIIRSSPVLHLHARTLDRPYSY